MEECCPFLQRVAGPELQGALSEDEIQVLLVESEGGLVDSQLARRLQRSPADVLDIGVPHVQGLCDLAVSYKGVGAL